MDDEEPRWTTCNFQIWAGFRSWLKTGAPFLLEYFPSTKHTFLNSSSGLKACILHNQHAQLARTESVKWWMTFNTLWTQQMLNILISCLRARTHTPAALLPPLMAWAWGGPNTPMSPSLPFIILPFFPPSRSIIRGASGIGTTSSIGIIAVMHVPVKAEAMLVRLWGRTDTWSVVTGRPPLGEP